MYKIASKRGLQLVFFSSERNFIKQLVFFSSESNFFKLILPFGPFFLLTVAPTGPQF